MDSILSSVKKLLGIEEAYEHFDVDIILHINSAFSILAQLGAGPPEGFTINDSSAVWEDFFPNSVLLNMVKTYIFAKVKMLFDPPTSGATMESMTNMISEYEFRIRAEVDW